ncbi:MAG: hypothetical protein IJM95_01155 [Anaerotignum sp.]|nr:hypothetical protein [Anaerotignum sp.]
MITINTISTLINQLEDKSFKGILSKSQLYLTIKCLKLLMKLLQQLIENNLSGPSDSLSKFKNKSFFEIIKERMEALDIKNNKGLIKATHLDPTTCSKIMNYEKHPSWTPSLKITLPLCIALRFTFEETEYLLKLNGHALSPEKPVHCEYIVILSVYLLFDWDINDCNMHLKEKNMLSEGRLGNFDIDESI